MLALLSWLCIWLSNYTSSAKVFIPGKSCGVDNSIRIMDDVPEDFSGDITGLACTLLKDAKNWHRYYSTAPGMAFEVYVQYLRASLPKMAGQI